MENKQSRVWLKFIYKDGSNQICELGKHTSLSSDVPKIMFHVDMMNDEKYLMITNQSILPKGMKLDKIEVVRE